MRFDFNPNLISKFFDPKIHIQNDLYHCLKAGYPACPTAPPIPEGSHVVSRDDSGEGTTPAGSHVVVVVCFYRHSTPAWAKFSENRQIH